MRDRPAASRHRAWLHIFSIEDETGIANAIIDPALYEANRNLVTYGKVLLIEGMLQNIDKVVHVRMQHIAELTLDAQLALGGLGHAGLRRVSRAGNCVLLIELLQLGLQQLLIGQLRLVFRDQCR